MSSEDVSDIMMESLVLSIALVERFEIMEENKLTAFKAKQSIKASTKFLQNYIDKVFDVTGETDDVKQHMKSGASHLIEIGNRVERSLKVQNLANLENRKEDLKKILSLAPLIGIQQDELFNRIVKSGILEY